MVTLERSIISCHLMLSPIDRLTNKAALNLIFLHLLSIAVILWNPCVKGDKNQPIPFPKLLYCFLKNIGLIAEDGSMLVTFAFGTQNPKGRGCIQRTMVAIVVIVLEKVLPVSQYRVDLSQLDEVQDEDDPEDWAPVTVLDPNNNPSIVLDSSDDDGILLDTSEEGPILLDTTDEDLDPGVSQPGGMDVDETTPLLAK